MGLAGKWQEAGQVEVFIQNSGPSGRAVQIQVMVPNGLDLTGAARALDGTGIELV